MNSKDILKKSDGIAICRKSILKFEAGKKYEFTTINSPIYIIFNGSVFDTASISKSNFYIHFVILEELREEKINEVLNI